MKVDIEKLNIMLDQIKKINEADLKDIIFVEDGMIVKPTQKQLDDFKFTGLSNVDFIRSGFYKGDL